MVKVRMKRVLTKHMMVGGILCSIKPALFNYDLCPHLEESMEALTDADILSLHYQNQVKHRTRISDPHQCTDECL